MRRRRFIITGNALPFLSAPVNKADSEDHFDNTGSYVAAGGNFEKMTWNA